MQVQAESGLAEKVIESITGYTSQVAMITLLAGALLAGALLAYALLAGALFWLGRCRINKVADYSPGA